MTKEVYVRLHHGGLLVIVNGFTVYKGGTLEDGKWFDEDKISRLELLSDKWKLGYKVCGPLYYKDTNSGNFIELCNDMDVSSYLSKVSDDEVAIVYVDSPVDDILQWQRVEEFDLEAHVARETITFIANMCLKREPKEDLEEVVEAVLESNDAVDFVREESEESKDSNSEEDSEVEIDEAFDDQLDDARCSDDEFLIVTKEGRKKDRLERSKKKKEAHSESSIKLGPVGVDKGLESYITSGNHYSGLLAGNEDYIGSSDNEDYIGSESSSQPAVTRSQPSLQNIWKY